jgi:hypothetical protein
VKIIEKIPETASTWARIVYASGETAVIEYATRAAMAGKVESRINLYVQGLRVASARLARKSTGGWTIDRPFELSDIGPFPSRRAVLAALKVLQS